MKVNNKTKLTYKHFTFAFIIILFIFYMILYPNLNIQEGKIGIINNLFLFVFLFLPFFILIYLGSFNILLYLHKNNERKNIGKPLFGVLLVWIVLSVPFVKGIVEVYYLIFEKEQVIVIDHARYVLYSKNVSYRGENYIYYLKLDNNQNLKINPSTYYQLQNKKHKLKIHYKQKASFISSLEVVSN